MFVLFKRTAEEHLTNIHLKRWCKFLWSKGMFVNVRFQVLTYGEYEDDLSSGMLCCVVL
jgi:hypothetical protein